MSGNKVSFAAERRLARALKCIVQNPPRIFSAALDLKVLDGNRSWLCMLFSSYRVWVLICHQGSCCQPFIIFIFPTSPMEHCLAGWSPIRTRTNAVSPCGRPVMTYSGICVSNAADPILHHVLLAFDITSNNFITLVQAPDGGSCTLSLSLLPQSWRACPHSLLRYRIATKLRPHVPPFCRQLNLPFFIVVYTEA